MAKEKDKKDAKPKQAPKEAPQQKAPSKEARKEKVSSAAPIEKGPQQPAPPARLAIQYREKIVPDLMQKFGYKTVMQVPRLRKITLNMGVGEAVADRKAMDAAIADLTKITGQKPLITKSRKAIASFKIRAGLAIGCKVTLRGDRMWEFLDRLISLAIPRIRDFRGLAPDSFDGLGNYTFGVTEQLIFPEVDYDKVDTTRGMDITIVTTGATDDQGRALLAAFGFPSRSATEAATGIVEPRRRRARPARRSK